MRKLLLLLLVFIIGTAFNFPGSLPADRVETCKLSDIDPKECLIDEQVAMRMMAHYRDCKVCPSPSKRKFTPNPEVRKYLEQTYTILKEEQLMGRYDSMDEERYRRAHKLDASDRRGKVGGFSTILMKYTVIPKSGFLIPQSRVIFSDEYSICPPPDGPGCN